MNIPARVDRTSVWSRVWGVLYQSDLEKKMWSDLISNIAGYETIDNARDQIAANTELNGFIRVGDYTDPKYTVAWSKQRSNDAWSKLKKIDYIEKSILGGQALTEIFLCISPTGTIWEITDGYQRYTALTDFKNNMFAVNGLKFRDMSAVIKQQFEDKRINVRFVLNASEDWMASMFLAANLGQQAKDGEVLNVMSDPISKFSKLLATKYDTLRTKYEIPRKKQAYLLCMHACVLLDCGYDENQDTFSQYIGKMRVEIMKNADVLLTPAKKQMIDLTLSKMDQVTVDDVTYRGKVQLFTLMYMIYSKYISKYYISDMNIAIQIQRRLRNEVTHILGLVSNNQSDIQNNYYKVSQHRYELAKSKFDEIIKSYPDDISLIT